MNMLLALVSGSILAFGLAFFFEYLDSRIKTPDELKAHLGLPSLGMVPALDAKAWKDKEPLLHAGVPPGFAEAFRTIRTNVLFSSAEEGSRVARRHQHRTRRGQDDGGERTWRLASRRPGSGCC